MPDPDLGDPRRVALLACFTAAALLVSGRAYAFGYVIEQEPTTEITVNATPNSDFVAGKTEAPAMPTIKLNLAPVTSSFTLDNGTANGLAPADDYNLSMNGEGFAMNTDIRIERQVDSSLTPPLNTPPPMAFDAQLTKYFGDFHFSLVKGGFAPPVGAAANDASTALVAKVIDDKFTDPYAGASVGMAHVACGPAEANVELFAGSNFFRADGTLPSSEIGGKADFSLARVPGFSLRAEFFDVSNSAGKDTHIYSLGAQQDIPIPSLGIHMFVGASETNAVDYDGSMQTETMTLFKAAASKQFKSGIKLDFTFTHIDAAGPVNDSFTQAALKISQHLSENGEWAVEARAGNDARVIATVNFNF